MTPLQRNVLICGIVVLDTLGIVGQVGGQALVWLAALTVLFILPYALVVRELGAAFTGGPYTWVRLAFGRPAGALCAVLYWIANRSGSEARSRPSPSRSSSRVSRSWAAGATRWPHCSSGSRSGRPSPILGRRAGSPPAAPWCAVRCCCC